MVSVPQPTGLGVVPQDALGWPNIPGVLYTGLITVRHLFDWGPLFDNGILTINPPDFSGPVYPSFVSRVDEDGNEVAGIRLPPVAVPVATTTGWALRAAAFGGPDGCESSGQWIPFATTEAERLATGDPRKSLEERYEDHDGYVKELRDTRAHGCVTRTLCDNCSGSTEHGGAGIFDLLHIVRRNRYSQIAEGLHLSALKGE